MRRAQYVLFFLTYKVIWRKQIGIDVKTPHVTDNGHHSPLPSCLCTPKYLTKHTWRRHTRLRHTHNSVGSALHTHRRDPDTRIQVGHTTNTQSQYTLQFNTQVRHVRSVRALGPEGPSRVLKLLVSRDAPAHSLTTHGAGASQPTQDRALGSILYFIPHSSPFSFEAVETILYLSLHRES